jgi:hypothetical protein
MVSDHPLDETRVAHLVNLLRKRTPGEITTSVLGLAGSLSPEMWRALELLRLERRRTHKGKRHSESMPGAGAKVQIVSADDEV